MVGTARFTALVLLDALILLTGRASGSSLFNNHIARTKTTWQFTPELSLRVILQYNAILASREFTRLETSKNFNADFLFTYLVNPWTALYLGYNGNLQNLELVTGPSGPELVRTNRLQTDARQFFIKLSYLLPF